ncbi:hypothetical protein [Tenggerimyces flavus]|uniref:Uncharacterized protein n=1 Tax=Tenggerimyces flavus TaxID=1708749 RepID=A0ABV7Y914_9ACTN|nr:hypothetical protein [Tenggerimyces flavus]MBM7783608.1 hypothetical protein [Tenggerimyces flavus]
MTERESPLPDRLVLAVRTACESDDPSRVDAAIARAVLEALLVELPEHFGPEAHQAYSFWLKNRIAALRAGRHFQPWVMTTSYQRYPQLLMCDPL